MCKDVSEKESLHLCTLRPLFSKNVIKNFSISRFINE